MSSVSPFRTATTVLNHQAIVNHRARKEKIRQYNIKTESLAAVVTNVYVSLLAT
jgi:hypothetical protein